MRCYVLRLVGAGVPDGPFVGHGRKPEKAGDRKGRPYKQTETTA